MITTHLLFNSYPIQRSCTLYNSPPQGGMPQISDY